MCSRHPARAFLSYRHSTRLSVFYTTIASVFMIFVAPEKADQEPQTNGRRRYGYDYSQVSGSHSSVGGSGGNWYAAASATESSHGEQMPDTDSDHGDSKL